MIDSMAYRTAFNIADLSPAMPAIVFESIAKPRTVIFERYLLDFHYWGMPLIAWIGIVLLGGWLLFCRRDFAGFWGVRPKFGSPVNLHRYG